MSKSANLLSELDTIQFEFSGKILEKEVDKKRLNSIQDFARQIFEEGVSAGVIAAHKQNFTKPNYKD
jgi:hypothetical protein